MLYLGKNPSLALPDKDKHPWKAQSHTSIFPIDKSGFFQELSLLHKPPTQYYGCDAQSPTTPTTTTTTTTTTTPTPWQWCAFPTTSSEFRAMLVPLPPEGSRPLVIAPSTGDIFCMRTPFSSSSSSPSFLWRYSPNADPETWEPLCIPSDASLVTTCNQHLGRKSYVPLSTITATLLGHHLYVAGGLPVPAASRYDLHAKTWERLPDMHHLRVQAASTECEGRIYVVGGRALDTRYSAEVYDPTAGAWTLIKDFVPQPAEECVVATLGKRLVMLTRSKIEPEWQLRVRDGEAWHELGEVPDSVGQRWRRAEMVPVGSEIWVVEDRWWMLKCVGGGIRVWPTFSGPGFWPEGNAVGGREGFANAFSLVDGGKGVEWRKIPIFSVPVKGL